MKRLCPQDDEHRTACRIEAVAKALAKALARIPLSIRASFSDCSAHEGTAGCWIIG